MIIENFLQLIRNSQDKMTVNNSRMQFGHNLLYKVFRPYSPTSQAERPFASEGNTVSVLATIHTTILDISKRGISAIDHFGNSFIVMRGCITGVFYFKIIPEVCKDLDEGVLLVFSHSKSLSPLRPH